MLDRSTMSYTFGDIAERKPDNRLFYDWHSIVITRLNEQRNEG